MIVIDASVLAPALADDGPDGDRARKRLANERLTAPELIDLEVVSVLRGMSRAGKLPARRAELALADLLDLPFERVPHRPLLLRCWSLRDNISVYDATYVALARQLDVKLLTADRRLARACVGVCEVETLASS